VRRYRIRPLTHGNPKKAVRNAEIARRWGAGEAASDLVKEYGLSRARIVAIARSEGCPPRRVDQPKTERNREIARRYRRGDRVADMVRDYGISRGRVHAIAQRNGCSKRYRWRRPAAEPRTITKTCEHCGEEFTRGPEKRAQRFCSRSCAGLARWEGRRKYTDDDLLRMMSAKTMEAGRDPTENEVNRDPAMPAHGTYIKRFGSWGRAHLLTRRYDEARALGSRGAAAAERGGGPSGR